MNFYTDINLEIKRNSGISKAEPEKSKHLLIIKLVILGVVK